MNDDERLHLEFVQGAITRMNSNSFQIKSLAITIIAALIALYASNQNIAIVFLGYPLTVLFWFLDSFYLLEERKFRALYDEIAGLTTPKSVILYDMSKKDKYTGPKLSISSTATSKTIAPIYGFITALLILFLYL